MLYRGLRLVGCPFVIKKECPDYGIYHHAFGDSRVAVPLLNSVQNGQVVLESNQNSLFFLIRNMRLTTSLEAFFAFFSVVISMLKRKDSLIASVYRFGTQMSFQVHLL